MTQPLSVRRSVIVAGVSARLVWPIRRLHLVVANKVHGRRGAVDADARVENVDVDAARVIELVADRALLRTAERRPDPLQGFHAAALEGQLVAREHLANRRVW